MLLRTTVSALASISYLLVSLTPCPDPTLLENETTAVRAIESVRVQANASSKDSHHHHDEHQNHHAEKPRGEAAHETVAPQHDPDEAKLALRLTVPCPCGCGDKSKSSASGGKLGPRVPACLSVIEFPGWQTEIPSIVVALTERPAIPQKPIPIANLIYTTVC